MNEHSAARAASSAEVHLRLIRADGSVHELGRVSASYQNPIRNAWWRLVASRLAQRRIDAANRGAPKGKE